jgi:hypothetical protein
MRRGNNVTRGASMRYAATIVCFSALAGCADVTSQAQLTQAHQMYNNQDDNECRSQGLTTGTDPYFSCRDSLAKAHLDAIEAEKTAHAQAEAAQAQAAQAQQAGQANQQH